MPYDEKTGKSYPYTEEGIEQYNKDKVKGMPMKNMKYWREKGVLPGINPELGSGQNLEDGRSPSSALQFAPEALASATRLASTFIPKETKEKIVKTTKKAAKTFFPKTTMLVKGGAEAVKRIKKKVKEYTGE